MNLRILWIEMIIVVTIIMIGYHLPAQDSLFIALSSLPSDSARIQRLTKEIEAAIYTEPDMAIKLADFADSIAHNSMDSLLMAHGKNLVGMAYYSKGRYDRSIEMYLKGLS